jgi:hypothetical protein
MVVVGSSLIGAVPMFDAVARVLGVARPYFYLFHCTLIFLVWWYWYPLVDRLAARGSMNAPKKAALQGARNRIVLMLVAIEVFVVMGFPFRFLSSPT